MAALSFPPEVWLDAMAGVSYVVAPNGRILRVGKEWDRFAGNNDSPLVTSNHVVGRDLFSMIDGESVRDAYRLMHERIIAGSRDVICFTFRCDAPEAKRTMRMAITALRSGKELAALLYQSQLVSEIDRPPLGLFSASRLYHDGYERPEPSGPPLPQVSICSFCHAAAWPLNAPRDDREWIAPEVYYARGGSSEIRLSHGICPECLDSLAADD
jgi:hypothetical protein